MLLTLLKSKIHRAKITSTNEEYLGSIAICPKLLRASGIVINEKVQVLNFENGNRFETYAISGADGEIGLRGPAAKLGRVGDHVIILAFAAFSPDEVASFSPKIIFVDEQNKIR